MADVALSPVNLTIGGGAIPVPFVALTPAVIRMTGGGITTTGSTESGLESQYLRLDRLLARRPIVEGPNANIYFQGYIQKFCESIEFAFNNLRDQVAAIQALHEADAIIDAKASQANVKADEAQTQLALSTSTLEPLNVLSADSSGTVTIAAHSRVYTDKTVSVNAGSVTGLTVGVFYRIYYNDAGREGGAVSYIATQDDVVQAGVVHVIGGISIPATGMSEGKTITPPGYVIEP